MRAEGGVIPARPTLNIMQAAAAVGVCRRTLYNWLEAGKIEYLRTASGTVRIFEDSLWRTRDGQRLPQPGEPA